MRLIDRYVMREVFYTLLAVTPVLLLIFLSHRFVLYLGDVAGGHFTEDILPPLLALNSISILPLLLPLVFYLSVLLALGRLYRDSEMIVLAACGVSPTRVLSTVIASALGLAVIVAALSIYVVPWAIARSDQIAHRAESAPEISLLTAGRFKESRAGDRIVYVEEISPDFKEMHNVFIQSRERGKVDILAAQSGHRYVDKNGNEFVVLEHGNRYQWTPNRPDYKIANYEKYTLRIRQRKAEPEEDLRKTRSIAALLNSDERQAKAEVQWRLSMPLSAILLAMLGALLARTTPRQGRYAKLFMAIVLYIIYNNLLSVARAWVDQGRVPPLIGLWWVHALLLLGIILLYVRQAGVNWLFGRMGRKE